jgi:hypothetical protein
MSARAYQKLDDALAIAGHIKEMPDERLRQMPLLVIEEALTQMTAARDCLAAKLVRLSDAEIRLLRVSGFAK